MEKAEIFEHLPTRVLAIQFTSDNIRDCCKFVRPYINEEYNSEEFYELLIDDLVALAKKQGYITLNTLEGNMKANINKCWIVRGTKDELWAIENEIFKNTYYKVK